MKEMKDFLNQMNIDKTKYIVVACSGGPDSMCLLYLLKFYGYNIICAHVNHNLRKISSAEYQFVYKYCLDNNIIFEGLEIKSYKNHKFSEQEAREKRYDFFENILKKYNTNILVTAHHGDDLIETILMRLIRGSNLQGYRGFDKISKYKDFYILRPLIFYTKQEIQNYVESMNIPYVIDDTNYSEKYTRNRIRLNILPFLKKENQKVNKKFLIFNEELEKASSFINAEVTKYINDNYKNKILNLNKFLKLPLYIREKEIEQILLDLFKKDIVLLKKIHIENILSLANKKTNNKIILPKNMIIKKQYDKLYFDYCCSNNKIDYEYLLTSRLDIENFGEIYITKDNCDNNNYIIRLNSKNITLPIRVRNKRSKDKMKVKNLDAEKSIKKIFIDEKIDFSLRNSWPIVTDSNDNILWIPGIKKSEFDCCNNEFYDIIIKYTKKENKYEEK